MRLSLGGTSKLDANIHIDYTDILIGYIGIKHIDLWKYMIYTRLKGRNSLS